MPQGLFQTPVGVDRIHGPAVIRLRFPLSCQLLSKDHAHLLETSLKSLPCDPSRNFLTTQQLPFQRPLGECVLLQTDLFRKSLVSL